MSKWSCLKLFLAKCILAKYDPELNRLCAEIGSNNHYQIADHGARNKRGLPLSGGESDC